MPLRFAFVGFRHAHIKSLYHLVETTDGLEIVGHDTLTIFPTTITIATADNL